MSDVGISTRDDGRTIVVLLPVNYVRPDAPAGIPNVEAWFTWPTAAEAAVGRDWLLPLYEHVVDEHVSRFDLGDEPDVHLGSTMRLSVVNRADRAAGLWPRIRHHAAPLPGDVCNPPSRECAKAHEWSLAWRGRRRIIRWSTDSRPWTRPNIGTYVSLPAPDKEYAP